MLLAPVLIVSRRERVLVKMFIEEILMFSPACCVFFVYYVQWFLTRHSDVIFTPCLVEPAYCLGNLYYISIGQYSTTECLV